ncbi:MAG: methyltransferase domain-containing protein [Pseudonocardia sp.]|nr:methyltransferase domain-containing protein [Pseudonocardia sp.]
MNVTDPTSLYRVRDGAYAADLLIAAVTEFDVFTWLAVHGPARAEVLRAALRWAERPADVLLTYAAALDLVSRDLAAGDVVELTALAREHFVAGSAYDLRTYYGSLAERPAAREFARVLRTDEPAPWASAISDGDADRAGSGNGGARDWSGRLADVEFASRITAAMDARGAFLAPALARATADLPVGRLLDVGGSSGIYAAAVLEQHPTASAAVFERAPVDQAARTLLAERGQNDRIDVVTGDMFVDPLPTAFDVHLYSQVLHDWDRSRVEHLLAASYRALPPGGWLLDHDTHVDADKTGPLPVAEYSALLMHSTPGKCWSTGELAAIAEAVGYIDITVRPTAADRSVLLARVPR